jgi:hypothetical protein
MFQSRFGIAQLAYARIAISTNPRTKFSRCVVVVAKEFVYSATACAMRPSWRLRILFLESSQYDISFDNAWLASIQIILFTLLGNTLHDAILFNQ